MGAKYNVGDRVWSKTWVQGPMTVVGTNADLSGRKYILSVTDAHQEPSFLYGGKRCVFQYDSELTSAPPPGETGDVIETLRKAFPHGHEKFIPKVVEIVKLHSDKNYDYARGGNPLGNFNRVSTWLKQYDPLMTPAAVALTYAAKQMDAVLWAGKQSTAMKVEGVVDRLRDVAVYALIASIILEEEAHDTE